MGWDASCTMNTTYCEPLALMNRPAAWPAPSRSSAKWRRAVADRSEDKSSEKIVKRLRDLHLISCAADMKDTKNETLPSVAADHIEKLERELAHVRKENDLVEAENDALREQNLAM